jgi:hypothetical protein
MTTNLPNSVRKTLTVAGLFLSLAGAALAVPITGSINFNSQFTSSVGDLLLPGTITINAPTTVNTIAAPTGSFTGLSGTVTTNDSFGINQAPGGNTVTIAPSTTIWSVGGFSFVSTSIFEEANTSGIIAIKSFGFLSGPGDYTATPGVWTGTFQLNGQTLSSSFSAGSASVPDGGSTAALLGLSLLGVVWFSKRKV